MYYKKRPELVSMVEESYRAYRALAERYDHLSKDLQSANRTIASVFPDQVPFSMDEDDEENGSQASTSSSSPDKPGVPKPKAPFQDKNFRSQSMLLSKGHVSSAKDVDFPCSGLSQNAAVDEIDKLQKEILAMQTEGEFVKSSYEQGYNRLCEIENQITEKQKRVCYLQDEFGVGSIIDDNEARTLMATTALRSCQVSLDKLKEKYEQSTEEARVESRKIKHVNQKFEALRNKFSPQQKDQQDKHKHVDNMVYEIDSVEKERQDLEELRKEIEEKLGVSSCHSLTMPQLVEKIDDLVQRVVSLETAVFSENALVKRLKSDADELEARVKRLEDDKEALIEGSEITNNRMNELERELCSVKDLVKTVVAQNNSLKADLTEACCNINHLSVELQAVKMDEGGENRGVSGEVKTGANAKPDREMEEHEIELAPGDDNSALKDTDISSAEGTNDVDSDESSNYKYDVDSEKGPEQLEEGKAESDTASSIAGTEIEEVETNEEDEQPNWRQLYLNGLDDREKNLLDEYSSVLQNYKEVRKKLNEVDKKNRDGFFELTLQIRELKKTVASKDGEIQSLRQKKSFEEENKDGNFVEEVAEPRLSPSQESTMTYSIQSSPLGMDQGNVESTGNGMQVKPASHQAPPPVLTVEDKIRSGIDNLIEENLEFWLRFSTSFHQIQKYQTSVQDLKAELSTLREKKKQEGNAKEEPLKSEARPVYSHLREIKTELILWLENNAVLKDEVQGRYASLCNIQEEIVRVSKASSGHAGEAELNGYQAAKFQGEVLNMKLENNKVFDELKTGFSRVKQLKHEVEKVMGSLEREFGALSSSTTQNSGSRTGRSRIPLKSFLFGIKLNNSRQQKEPSMSACRNPTLQRQLSYVIEPTEPS
ncbi:hypothetical protein PTKIN_Ptkin01aG0050500 [Pterospermum kingtungense]